MTIISALLFIISTIGVLGFACWDNDIEIPVFYSFGQFEADWWFHDKLKPGKPHLESHDKDGPPLVARTSTGGGPIPFPYPDGQLIPTNQSNIPFMTGTYYDDWGTSLKMNSKNTPINGMYGVSNQKESDRTYSTEYYPNASDPADYIAARMLGPQADWTELEGMGDRLKIYNTKVFKSGTPFKAAIIGPGKTEDKRWTATPNYAAATGTSVFMPPLTSTGAGNVVTGDGSYVNRSENDYSGAEYAAYDPTFEGSVEQSATLGYRPDALYQETMSGAAISPHQHRISAWPGEYPDSYKVDPPTNTYVIQNAFYDSQNEGVTYTTQSGVTGTNHGWGAKGVTTPSYMGYYPGAMQKDYIVEQLSQENPITAIPTSAAAQQ